MGMASARAPLDTVEMSPQPTVPKVTKLKYKALKRPLTWPASGPVLDANAPGDSPATRT